MEVLKKQKLVICGYWVLSEHKPLSENAFIHKLLFRRERGAEQGRGGKERKGPSTSSVFFSCPPLSIPLPLTKYRTFFMLFVLPRLKTLMVVWFR